MADARLKKGGDTITIPLLEEGGSVLFSADLGKPETDLRTSGALYPRSIDNWSGLQNLTLRGRFTSSNAYANARDLIDTVSSDLDNDELRLDVDLPEYDTDMLVAPSAGSDQAVSVTYEAGKKNDVIVDGSFTRVGRIDGAGSRTATTPTTSGSGPLEISALGNTVSVSADLSVTRTVGRPNDVIRRQPGAKFPYYINKQKTVSETITIECQLHENIQTDLQNIGQIFREQLGRNAVTLNFNGIFGLGSFDVMPTGSAPFRQARRAGYEGMTIVPTFEFSRVTV